MPYSVELKNVSLTYGLKTLFANVTLTLADGNIYTLVGSSGCGKSTFLEMAAGLVKPSLGAVYWNGKDLSKYSRKELTEARQQVGYLFQKPALISNLTVKNNVALPLKYHGNIDDEILDVWVDRHLDKFGILDLANQLPESLSLGEARLVSIARALIMTPRFLFLDEPLNGLDPATAKSILHHINTLCLKEHITVLIATHHFKLLEGFNTQVILLEDGMAQHFYSVKEARQSTLANSIIQHNFDDRGFDNG